MTRLPLTGVILVLALLFGRASAGQELPATKVVEDFWEMETQGGRLTTDGWNAASRFFIRMHVEGPSPGRTIHVIRNGRDDRVSETVRTETWTEVLVNTNQVGEIDSKLHFTPSPKSGPYGVKLLRGPDLTFHLVLTDKQWLVGPDGVRQNGAAKPAQWLIDCDRDDLWINQNVAIRYVTELRDRSADATIRRNADDTLAKLRNMQ